MKVEAFDENGKPVINHMRNMMSNEETARNIAPSRFLMPVSRLPTRVPKIKGNVIKINEDTFAVRLEKLTPIPNELYYHLYAAVRAMVQTEGVRDIHKDTVKFLATFKKEYPGVFSVVTDMMKLPWRLDLGKANIMMRGNVPVIVDPIADI